MDDYSPMWSILRWKQLLVLNPFSKSLITDGLLLVGVGNYDYTISYGCTIVIMWTNHFELNVVSFLNKFVVLSLQSDVPLVGNVAPDFEAEAVFDQEFINVIS